MNLFHDKQLFNIVPFQSNKFSKKELCVDNIKTIGDVYCPTCRNEKCVYISTNKTTSFFDCEKCEACCHVLNIRFRDQKPTSMLFDDGDGTHCFARNTSSDYENHLHFEEISPSTTVTRTKKGQIESKHGINLFVAYWLII